MGDTTPSGFRSSHQAARIPLKKNQGLFLLKSLRGSIPPRVKPESPQRAQRQDPSQSDLRLYPSLHPFSLLHLALTTWPLYMPGMSLPQDLCTGYSGGNLPGPFHPVFAHIPALHETEALDTAAIGYSTCQSPCQNNVTSLKAQISVREFHPFLCAQHQ